MEYRKATGEEAQLVCDIVKETKAKIFPHYYTQAVVDFFGRPAPAELAFDEIEKN